LTSPWIVVTTTGELARQELRLAQMLGEIGTQQLKCLGDGW
jgi:hypothetical protein